MLLRATASLVALLFCAAPLAQAADTLGIPWKETQFTYVAQDEDVAKALQKTCSTLGVQPVISKAVTGKISGRFDGVEADQFFLTLMQACSLVWYYDGNALYVYADSEITNETVPVPDVTLDELQKAFDNLGITLQRKGLYVKISNASLYVSGPPRYVSLVKDVATGISEINQAVPDGIEVFRLKQAWAYDTTYTANGSQLTIPGVSTILQNLLPSYAGGSYSASTPVSQPVSSALPKLTQTSVQNPQNNPTAPHPPSSSNNYAGTSGLGQANNGASASGTAGSGVALPSFSPTQNMQQSPTVTYDVRENAVIVHDNKDRLKSYATVIADLDRPVKIVQINASIVDVNTDSSLKYGNQFLFKNNSFGAALLPPGTVPASTVTGAGSAGDAAATAALTAAGNLLSSGGLTVGTVILDNSVQFISGVQLLQENGLAHILSQPSVVTLDNLQAVIQRADTFYVKVPGTYSTDLYNVNAGTVLTVTPHLVETPGEKPVIKLIVQINDGAVDNTTDGQVGGLPTTTSDSLNTQAFLKENQSLLVGGIVREDNETTESGVPVLKDIPLIGPLFKQRSKSKVTTKRLFLITPKIVTASYDVDRLKPYFKTLQDDDPNAAPPLHSAADTQVDIRPAPQPNQPASAQPAPHPTVTAVPPGSTPP